MSFVSFPFLFLFLTAVAARVTFGRNKNGKGYLFFLLAASLVFYASYIPSYLFLLIGITTVDFLMGKGIAGALTLRRRKLFLLVSLFSNLGLLAYYKYSHFFLDELQDTLYAFDLGFWKEKPFNIVLPLGISFITLRNMSYTIDVYRGVVEPFKSYWRYLLFVSFFTHLVSGPIVRAKEFVSQFDRQRRPRLQVFLEGAYLMVRGFFLKMVVADNLAGYVDGSWGTESGNPAGPVVVKAVLFACQIFADFEGYTSIARGAAYLLGFRLPLNFNNPYLAATFKEFWTRWHITLCQWMRDYLYIPLGGNRVRRRRLYFNLLLVMLVAGLWHGASYTFLYWGGILGFGLVLERATGLDRIAQFPPWVRIGWYLAVQAVILVAWIFFRSSDLQQAFAMVGSLWGGNWDWEKSRNLLPGFAFCAPVVFFHLGGLLREKRILPPPGPLEKGIGCAVMLFLILSWYGENYAFIYFHF